MMFPITDPQRHWGCRVNDRVTWEGFHALIVQNELIQIVILVDKGAEIVQFLYKPLDIDFLWHSPNPLRTASAFVPIGGEPTSPFFDRWSGGWFEVLPNGGSACQYKGASFGFFAETINLPWEYRILEDTPERVSIGLWVKLYRTPLLLKKPSRSRRAAQQSSLKNRFRTPGMKPSNSCGDTTRSSAHRSSANTAASRRRRATCRFSTLKTGRITVWGFTRPADGRSLPTVTGNRSTCA